VFDATSNGHSPEQLDKKKAEIGAKFRTVKEEDVRPGRYFSRHVIDTH
jgi:hypothetical protein